MTNKTYGGYLPLDLQDNNDIFYPGALRYRSARNALYHLLCVLKPSRIWLPRLICDSVADAVMASKTNIVWYSLDENLLPKYCNSFSHQDIFLYVNYLGQCEQQEKKLASFIPPERILFDHSQAFYSRYERALGNLYSPRKFFGVPDGGLLDTPCEIPKLQTVDNSSHMRCAHLILQLEQGTPAGYAAYVKAENMLAENIACSMSVLTERLLCSVDYLKIKELRERNFGLMHALLGDLNSWRFSSHSVKGPFCYPFLLPGRQLHQKLINENVFVATYWREVLLRVEQDSVEAHFVNSVVPLPCDQRYSESDIRQLCNIVRTIVEKEID
ncbi:hypothetical protein [Enterobacter cancerogenus]|uniref:hypothetical protein n=1 Tax=Enterobacter cancerogenus TaxID=69218 RepID=UPI000FD6C382|nr:hypothetical protein [Enterobacter cancerogenus]